MKLLLQRVSSASVTVAGEQIASIGRGLLVFVGVLPGDGAAQIDWLTDKMLGLRIFPDDADAADAEGAGRDMNRSVCDVDGEVLLVSQFTLAADTSKGKRPGFSSAAPPEQARELFQAFVQATQSRWRKVQTGRFGADMQVALVNDGPVTFLLER